MPSYFTGGLLYPALSPSELEAHLDLPMGRGRDLRVRCKGWVVTQQRPAADTRTAGTSTPDSNRTANEILSELRRQSGIVTRIAEEDTVYRRVLEAEQRRRQELLAGMRQSACPGPAAPQSWLHRAVATPKQRPRRLLNGDVPTLLQLSARALAGCLPRPDGWDLAYDILPPEAFGALLHAALTYGLVTDDALKFVFGADLPFIDLSYCPITTAGLIEALGWREPEECPVLPTGEGLDSWEQLSETLGEDLAGEEGVEGGRKRGLDARHIRWLDVSHCRGIDQGPRLVRALADTMPSLVRLHLDGCLDEKGGPATFQAIALRLHSLRVLGVGHCSWVADRELLLLCEQHCLPYLATLHIDACPLVSRFARRELRNARPQLEIET